MTGEILLLTVITMVLIGIWYKMPPRTPEQKLRYLHNCEMDLLKTAAIAQDMARRLQAKSQDYVTTCDRYQREGLPVVIRNLPKVHISLH